MNNFIAAVQYTLGAISVLGVLFGIYKAVKNFYILKLIWLMIFHRKAYRFLYHFCKTKESYHKVTYTREDESTLLTLMKYKMLHQWEGSWFVNFNCYWFIKDTL